MNDPPPLPPPPSPSQPSGTWWSRRPRGQKILIAGLGALFVLSGLSNLFEDEPDQTAVDVVITNSPAGTQSIPTSTQSPNATQATTPSPTTTPSLVTSPNPTTMVAPTTTATPTTTAKVLAGLGEEVRDGKFAFVVTAIDNPGNVYDPEGLLADEAVGTWLLVRMTVTNIGDRQWSFSSGDQRLLWDDKTFSAEGFAWNGTSFENLNPGLTFGGDRPFSCTRRFSAGGDWSSP